MKSFVQEHDLGGKLIPKGTKIQCGRCGRCAPTGVQIYLLPEDVLFCDKCVDEIENED